MMTTPLLRELMFKNRLVPMGQLLEVLLYQLKTRTPYPPHVAAAHAAFELLNLASCYAINPETTGSKLDALDSVLSPLMQQLRRTLPTEATATAKGRDTAIACLRKLIAEMAIAILKAIGYSEETRGTWIAAQTAQTTPITQGKRIHKWRTFVRHCDWALCLELAPPSAQAAARATKSRFERESRVGAMLAATLWTDTFADEHRLSASSEPGPDRLPVGMRVMATKEGLLRVQLEYCPDQVLSKAQRSDLALGPVSVSLQEELKPRVYLAECDVSGLAATVSKGTSWLDAQKGGSERVLTAYAECMRERAVRTISSKLSRHFDSQEKRLLLEVLTSELSAA